MKLTARALWSSAAREARDRRLEDQLALQLRVAGLDQGLEREYRFSQRRWRLDFAYPINRLAIEVHGGTYVNGAHSRGARQRLDFDKQNALVLLGWRLLIFDTVMVRRGEALRVIEQALLNP